MEDEVPFTLNSINPTTNPQRGPLQRYNTKVMRGRFNQETNDGKQARTVVIVDFKLKLLYSSVFHDYCAIQWSFSMEGMHWTKDDTEAIVKGKTTKNKKY